MLEMNLKDKDDHYVLEVIFDTEPKKVSCMIIKAEDSPDYRFGVARNLQGLAKHIMDSAHKFKWTPDKIMERDA